ncbi:MAG: methyl-accepting chemotaxis protein [Anaerovoracaceae bacterium]
MKSIRLKLLLAFTAIVLALNVGVGFFTISAVSKQQIRDTHSHLKDMAVQEAKYVKSLIDQDLSYVGVLAQNPIITNPEVSLDAQIAFFEKEAERAGFVQFGYADRNGKAIILNSTRASNDISDREFFKTALGGTPASSDVLFSNLDDQPVIVFASPVYRNGQISGVLYGRKDGLMLCDIVRKLQYKETGYAYMINNIGNTVGHRNEELVLIQDNDIENMKTDPALVGLGELTKQMTSGNVSSGEYTYNGVTKIAGYSPIEGSPWIVIFGVEKAEILRDVNKLANLLIAIVVTALLIGIALMFVISTGIARPIKRVTQAAKEIADGNFDVTLQVTSKDEIGQLAQAFNLTLDRLVNYRDYINEMSASLAQIAQGDLRVSLKMEYVGQFRKLKDSLEALTESLSSTLSQIQNASDQVKVGADQVASGAQAMSQGATEQASSIQQLSASIAEVTEQVKQNADNAKEVRLKAEEAGKELKESDAQMQDMIAAMAQITEKASEISKIIKIIDDIAFQTNILALNAAVEAARAGAAGKGFAVVADEVRNLAAKSAEAARNTSDLIEQTIDSVNSGSSIADRTAQSLTKSAEQTMATVSLIDRITDASQDQATAIVQINQGVEQISTVVQTNAATVEESAAASEELSGQADLLRELVSEFTLSDSGANRLSYDYDSDIEMDMLPPSKY